MHDEQNPFLADTDHRRLVRAATRLLGWVDAEDAVQDAYVRALEAAPGELNAAQAWLLTVMRHLAVDRLRRRDWMQQWLVRLGAGDAPPPSPAAEADAALAQDVRHALRLLAGRLTAAEGAAVLLHEVFDASHAEIAEAAGRSEAGSRQLLRRALQRLRLPPVHPTGRARRHAQAEAHEAGDEAVFRLYLQAVHRRDPQALWAMLRQPAIRASLQTGTSAHAITTACAPGPTRSGVVQVGGQLSLVLTLDGVTLCVVPLGAGSTLTPDFATC